MGTAAFYAFGHVDISYVNTLPQVTRVLITECYILRKDGSHYRVNYMITNKQKSGVKRYF